MPTDGSGDSPPAARGRGVVHQFGDTTALRGVDVELLPGRLTVLVGANGSGKTTLLRILAGIVDPTAGAVDVLGVEHPARSDRGTRRGLRRRVSYVSQDPALDPEMTGAEILALMATLYGVERRNRRRRMDELAASFGVTSHLSRRVGTWSGGLRRRLHLAAGMIQDPELLLLDEPTAGLDPEGRRLLWEDLRARAERGRAVAVVTHDLAAAERHAGHVVLLDRGTVIVAGSPRELLDVDGDRAADLTDAYRRHTGRDVTDLLPGKRAGRRRGGR